MRIAIFPIEKEKYQIDKKFSISTEIAYIISYLEKNNSEDIVFPTCDLDFLSKTKPDLVCIYAPYSFTYNQIVSISNEIKEKYNLPVILSGEHITALPKTLPLSCDVGILGDPEETLRSIVELKRNDLFNEKNLSKISGIVFSYKNQKIITDKPQYIKDINSLPMTRAVLQDMPGEWIPSIIIGRGKPVNNAWQSLTNQPVRLFSIDKITQDIIDLIANNYGLKTSTIKDYLLLYDKTFFKKFIDMCKEHKLVNYMRFNVKALISQLDEEVIYDLKNTMQVPKLTIQFLNPLEKFYKDLREEYVPYSKQKKILDLCYKYNINIEAKFLYNLPNETKEDTAKAYWFIKRNYFNKYSNMNIKLRPLSISTGSEFWQKAIFRKVIMENFNNWSSLNSFDEKTPILSNLGEDLTSMYSYIKNSLISKEDYFYLDIKHEPILDELRATSIQSIRSGLQIIKDNFSQYRYIDTEQLENEILKSMSVYDIKENLIFTLEEILSSNTNLTTKDIVDKISHIKSIYNKLKNDDSHNKLYYSNNLNYLTLEPIIHEIIKGVSIKNILQVSDKNIINLKNLFKNDYLEVDTIEPSLLNKPMIDLKLDKKYDSILLYFSLDSCSKIDKLLSFCHKNLNDNGLLIIPFYSAKNIISIIRMLTNKDINKLFYEYKRTNYFTPESMSKILKKNSFLIKEVENISFPYVKKFSGTEKIFKESFYNHLNINDIDKIFYVYMCRKSDLIN